MADIPITPLSDKEFENIIRIWSRCYLRGEVRHSQFSEIYNAGNPICITASQLVHKELQLRYTSRLEK